MTIPMPEPVAYPTDEWVDEFFGNPDETGFYSFRGDFGNIAYRFQLAAQAGDFITTDQAEAYKNACVRAALEQADQILEAMYTAALNDRVSEDEDDEQWNLACLARAHAISQAQEKIRALPRHDNE